MTDSGYFDELGLQQFSSLFSTGFMRIEELHEYCREIRSRKGDRLGM
jgi:hypothetical protein